MVDTLGHGPQLMMGYYTGIRLYPPASAHAGHLPKLSLSEISIIYLPLTRWEGLPTIITSASFLWGCCTRKYEFLAVLSI